MHRKVFSVGNSKGVSIPADYLAKLELTAGANVNVTLDEENDRIVIEPVRNKNHVKGVDNEFVAQVKEFIERYRPALEALARNERTKKSKTSLQKVNKKHGKKLGKLSK